MELAFTIHASSSFSGTLPEKCSTNMSTFIKFPCFLEAVTENSCASQNFKAPISPKRIFLFSFSAFSTPIPYLSFNVYCQHFLRYKMKRVMRQIIKSSFFKKKVHWSGEFFTQPLWSFFFKLRPSYEIIKNFGSLAQSKNSKIEEKLQKIKKLTFSGKFN